MQCCRLVDEVWVPSPWHRRLYAAAGCPAVHVVAETVDVGFWAPRPEARQPQVGTAHPPSFSSWFSFFSCVVYYLFVGWVYFIFLFRK